MADNGSRYGRDATRSNWHRHPLRWARGRVARPHGHEASSDRCDLPYGKKGSCSPRVPRRPKLRIGDVPVRAEPLIQLPQVVGEVGHRRPPPVPVAVVDAEDPQVGSVPGCGGSSDRGRGRVLGDVQVLLYLATGIRQERPLGADPVTELGCLQELVGGDGDDPCVAHLETGRSRPGGDAASGPQGSSSPWRGPGSSGRRPATRQPPPRPGVVGELVVGKGRADSDIWIASGVP